MAIAYIGELYNKDLAKEIAILTDKSILQIDTVQYDEENRILNFSINRRCIEWKNNLWGKRKAVYVGGYEESRVVIKEITDLKLNNKCLQSVNAVVILFGMQIEKGLISLSSVEETEGEELFSFQAKVSQYDIEII